MKSECSTALGLLAAIMTDVQSMYPSVRTELERDLAVIREALEHHGFGFAAITMPDVAAYLHRSLDAGFLVEDRPPMTGRKSYTDMRPRFLWDLWSRVFNSDGTLCSESDPDAILALRQILLAFKKYRKECDEHVVQQTVGEFAKTNQSLPRSWPDTWDSDVPCWSPRVGHPLWGVADVECRGEDLFHSPALSYAGLEFPWDQFRSVVGIFSTRLGPFDPYGSDGYGSDGDRGGCEAARYAFRSKHGPGAVYDKVVEFVKYDLVHWTHRLESVFPYDYFGSHNYEIPEYVRYVEHPSRLLAVPKTLKGPRLIAAEPTCHQWIQGGMDAWLRARLPRTFLSQSIDFQDQSASQQAALDASATRGRATVDLSSASDRLSTRLVEYCFQHNRPLLDALHACRTRVVEMPDGTLERLRMFATMGSACTFPVQTIVFSLVATWAVMLSRGIRKTTHSTLQQCAAEVRVFGDDIIVPTDAYPVLRSLLATLGLKVNESKSFSQGSFRESCGMDAYAGSDVTPAYFRTTYSPAPADLASVVEASNNFFSKGFWNAAHYIEQLIPEKERKLLMVKRLERSAPSLEEGRALGFTSFCGESTDHLRKRWSETLHRWEAKLIDTLSKVKMARGQGNGSLLQFFHEEPSVWLPYQGGQATGARVRKCTRWVQVDETWRAPFVG